MTRQEAKQFIEDVLDDTLENINFKLSMETDMGFEEIEELVDEVWYEQNKKN